MQEKIAGMWWDKSGPLGSSPSSPAQGTRPQVSHFTAPSFSVLCRAPGDRQQGPLAAGASKFELDFTRIWVKIEKEWET